MSFRMKTIYRKNTIKSHIVSIIGNFDISKTIKKSICQEKYNIKNMKVARFPASSK